MDRAPPLSPALGRLSEAELLEGLRQVARPLMLAEKIATNSCIAMTRCAIEVLRAFGLEAQPMNAEAVIANKVFVALLERGEITLDEKLPEWAIAAGAWAVGLGMRPHSASSYPPGEGGHVVALLNGKLIDLSLDQASRPQRGIVLEPVVVDLYRDDLSEPFSYLVNGSVYVNYHLLPGYKTWRDSKDWHQFHKRYGKVAAQIIRELRAA